MNLSVVVLAIPIFFTLMALELIYESISKRRTYRLNDAVTNISTGTLQQLTKTLLALFAVSLYDIVFQKMAITSMFNHPDNYWFAFGVAMLLWDLCYYWEHRMAHRVSLFWGGHSVHHQSEDYNLSVALRQTSTGFIWAFPFFLPMAVLGIPTSLFALVGGLNLLYQFWIHTEHIKRLPKWFEYIFNTPSHHRVHHGRDPKYIDKNYGGILIIWDRLFASFKAEEERPNYGLTKPLNSWNPVYANFAHYIELFTQVKKGQSFSDKLKILFKPPGWLPDYLGGYQSPQEVDKHYQKYNQTISVYINLYLILQFIAVTFTNGFYFFAHKGFELYPNLIYAAWIIFTTLMFGFLFESKNKWLSVLESIRLACIPLGVWYFMPEMNFPYWLLIVAIGFSIFSLLLFFKLLNEPDKPTNQYYPINENIV